MRSRAFAWPLLSLLVWGPSVTAADQARPIVLVGIDGADWLAIDRLVARGL